MKKLYIGIMSGTSLDAIDITLNKIDKNKITLIHSKEYVFNKKLKKKIIKTINNKITLDQLGKINNQLGKLFYKKTKKFIKLFNIKKSHIEAIGLHGQTLWHNPQKNFSLQLGNSHILATKLKIKTISDFRNKNMILKGEGAPFAPAFHQFILKNEKNTCVINLGGIANISVLNKKLIGYDTGMANILMDIWIKKHQNKNYDKDGNWAKSGKVDKKLLKLFLLDDYFYKAYPKSTGREKFNLNWIEDRITYQKSEDVQRTLLELTAITITNEVKKFNIKKMYLCGGGAKNIFLLKRMKALLSNTKIEVLKNSDMIESMAFAWFAYKRVHREKVNLKSVTGAKKNCILGVIYE